MSSSVLSTEMFALRACRRRQYNVRMNVLKSSSINNVDEGVDVG